MAKRFADTDLWDKQWFMDLSVKHKCLIQFLFAKCDPAGVWSANYSLASSFIGERVTAADMKEIAGRVRLISPNKFFIIDFIDFQYGKLSPACKPHVKVLELLVKHKIDSKGYPKGIHTLKEEEEEKEKDKDKETDKEKGVQGETKKSPPEEGETALGYEMSQAFAEINPDYPPEPSRDMPAIIAIANFLHTQASSQEKPMYEMDVGERKTVMRDWLKWCEWYRENGKNKSLEYLVKFKLQEVYSEIKNDHNGTDKRAPGKVRIGKDAGKYNLLKIVKQEIGSR